MTNTIWLGHVFGNCHCSSKSKTCWYWMNYTDDDEEFEKRQQFAILEHVAEEVKTAMLRQRHYDQKLIDRAAAEARLAETQYWQNRRAQTHKAIDKQMLRLRALYLMSRLVKGKERT